MSANWSTSWYDRNNKHGAPLCDFVKCRRHKRLVPARRGQFCAFHAREIDKIRANIEVFKNAPVRTPDVIWGEVFWRTQELLNRKQFHAGHVHYLLKLERLEEELREHE